MQLYTYKEYTFPYKNTCMHDFLIITDYNNIIKTKCIVDKCAQRRNMTQAQYELIHAYAT